MMKLKPFVIIFILLNLAGCSSKGPGDKYLKQITQLGQKNYQINKAELIAKYNLLNFHNKGQCLFAKNYGEIVGDSRANQKFLTQLESKFRDGSGVFNASHQQLKMIYHYITKLSHKYAILSSKEIKYLKNLQLIQASQIWASPFDLIDNQPNHKAQHKAYDNLIIADQILNKIPIFLPQTSPIMTSKFGPRKHPIAGIAKFHKGIDLAGKNHAMIYAAANGKVSMVARSPSYGNFILIDHAKGISTRYAHLSRVYLGQGDSVFQGELIGHQGNTGASTAEHLHFEIIHKGNPIDPLLFVGLEYDCRK